MPCLAVEPLRNASIGILIRLAHSRFVLGYLAAKRRQDILDPGVSRFLQQRISDRPFGPPAEQARKTSL
jgi:hypothetical protein